MCFPLGYAIGDRINLILGSLSIIYLKFILYDRVIAYDSFLLGAFVDLLFRAFCNYIVVRPFTVCAFVRTGIFVYSIIIKVWIFHSLIILEVNPLTRGCQSYVVIVFYRVKSMKKVRSLEIFDFLISPDGFIFTGISYLWGHSKNNYKI